MSHPSFRSFCETLESSGELRRIAEPVATELQITELADREMKSPGGGRALLFEKPTINGKESAFPLAINTMGSRRRMAMALGLLADPVLDALVTGESPFESLPDTMARLASAPAGALCHRIRY